MKYKYSRLQIFAKKLNVPKEVKIKIYNCDLSLKDFISYDLIGKVPFSCLSFSDYDLAYRLGEEGLKKLRTIDLNLMEKHLKDIEKLLMQYHTIPENLVELVNQIIISKSDREEKKIFLKSMLKNNFQMNDQNIEAFINDYGTILDILFSNSEILNNFDTKSIIENIIEKKDNPEKIKEYLKKFTDEILDNTYSEYKKYYDEEYLLSDNEYKEIFKFSSVEDYLKKFSYDLLTEKFINELHEISEDYLFAMPIPFKELLNENVRSFIGLYGLKNIVNFDNECGHFFTKDNCKMLKSMYDIYLRNDVNVLDPNKRLNTKKNIDEKGNRVDRPYTKDEFYEAMRRMIIYGPRNRDYHGQTPDYRAITGEFRARNPELFISEEAPKELQDAFYTKSITPQLLVEYPEFIQYLKGKNLGSCFRLKSVAVEGSNGLQGYENFYNFISSKIDFNDAINLITEYSEVLDTLLDVHLPNEYTLKFSLNDNLDQIKNKINEAFKKLIIGKRIIYPEKIPQNFVEEYPSMFLSSMAPKELQDAFYKRTIDTEFILSNPDYRKFLNDIDLELLFKYMPVHYNTVNECINFINALKQTFGGSDALDVMLIYGKYVEQVYENDNLRNFLYNPEFTQDDFLDELDKTILQNIIYKNMKYDENIPSHFKNNNQTLFLGSNVSQKIKDKFYNREFTLQDFSDNPELLNIFENTNVACAFPESMAWIIPLFNDSKNFKMANLKRLKVISAYYKIQDKSLKNIFEEYVRKYGTNINIEHIEYVSEVLSRLLLSNSSEIFTFRNELATQILKSKNPLEILNEIENVFIRNNIPTVGKIYSCFELLHPDFQGFNFKSSMISPVLKSSSMQEKKIIVFSDLIKSSFGSNNRSVNKYLKNIEIGSNLYKSIELGKIQFDSLEKPELKELTDFSNHLATLYNNTMKAKKENKIFTSTGYVLTNILELSKKLSPDGTLDYNLADRVIRMFCGFAGINTLTQAKEYIERKVKTADLRNRDVSNYDMTLEQGDFIKGIGDITYLGNILQNGSVSKEYLGASASSDATPLDTDVSMIMSSEGTISEKMNATAASEYGPIWFVLKNDDRFMVTRTINETLETKRDLSKIEVFYTGVLDKGHYGIRTGFASSEINYIVMEEYDPRVGLEIAMNGFYIPVANKEGKIIFTPKDYDKLREKMSGLSYFGEQSYSFSENLVTEETRYFAQQIKQSNYEVQVKREKINNIIKKSIEELGLHLKTNIDGDLSEGFVELIDTGSTGRGTNKPGDGDFDFMMRLDKAILSNPSRLNELKKTILKNFCKENSSELTGTGDFRLKSVQIDNDTSVDIDITFVKKTDKVSYSTDMALQDRLATIQRTDPERYKYVVANILLAKQVLKKAEVYKPNRGEVPQGGLGGVGIENWILQNGGSFIDAAKSFVEAADGKSFSEFKSTYQIWDFGDNHLAERSGQYAHDNFVANNMNEAGYKKMLQALKEYLKNSKITQMKTENMKR